MSKNNEEKRNENIPTAALERTKSTSQLPHGVLTDDPESAQPTQERRHQIPAEAGPERLYGILHAAGNGKNYDIDKIKKAYE